MSDSDDIKATIDNWKNGLDSGDIERMLATCDAQVVTVNNRQPTTVGSQAVRDKYVPRIEMADITSGYDIEQLEVFGDVAVVVGRFYGTMKNKTTGEVMNPEGRLVFVYKRAEHGTWKMILDMDNNYA